MPTILNNQTAAAALYEMAGEDFHYKPWYRAFSITNRWQVSAMRRGDSDKGIALFRKAIDLDHSLPYYHVNLGAAFASVGQLRGD